MINKALIICIAVGVVLSVFCKVLYDKVGELQRENKLLQKALETNLEAAKKKEERNAKELESLHKQINELNSINSECLNAPVDDSLAEFLQKLSETSNGTLSLTVTKQGRM